MNALQQIHEEFKIDNIELRDIKINLYLELSRLCNMNCEFCRNKSFDSIDYNLNKIINNLIKILPFLSEIDIGGGEPTFFMNDLVYLKKILTRLLRLQYFTKKYNII